MAELCSLPPRPAAARLGCDMCPSSEDAACGNGDWDARDELLKEIGDRGTSSAVCRSTAVPSLPLSWSYFPKMPCYLFAVMWGIEQDCVANESRNLSAKGTEQHVTVIICTVGVCRYRCRVTVLKKEIKMLLSLGSACHLQLRVWQMMIFFFA